MIVRAGKCPRVQMLHRTGVAASDCMDYEFVHGASTTKEEVTTRWAEAGQCSSGVLVMFDPR